MRVLRCQELQQKLVHIPSRHKGTPLYGTKTVIFSANECLDLSLSAPTEQQRMKMTQYRAHNRIRSLGALRYTDDNAMIFTKYMSNERCFTPIIGSQQIGFGI